MMITFLILFYLAFELNHLNINYLIIRRTVWIESSTRSDVRNQAHQFQLISDSAYQ